MKITPEQLYIRQTILKDVGEEMQQRLLKDNALIVGCGGLGSVAAIYLAASGLGTIHLVDFDVVNVSNLHRQVFYKTEDIGKPKAEVLAKHIEEISPFVKVTFSNIAISKSSVFDFINEYNYVLDCTDSLPVKYLLNDACVLKDKTLIYGSLYKFDGYVSAFNVKMSDGSYSANLRDAFPEISKVSIPNCSEVGTLNTIVGIIGLMQANEVLKLIGTIGNALYDQLLIYNSLENSQFKMKLKRSFTKEMIQQLFEIEDYIDANCIVQDESLLISTEEFKNQLSISSGSRSFEVISVIEDIHKSLPFKVDAKIPFSKLDDISHHIDQRVKMKKENNIFIVCNRGILSYTATIQLKKRYPDLNILSLKGGITSY